MTKLTTVLTVFAVVFPATASATQMTPLSKPTAERIAREYAETEGHRIWRIEAMETTVSCDRLRGLRRYPIYRYLMFCDMVDKLYYGGYSAPPIEVEAFLRITKIKPNRVRVRLEVPGWEVLPPNTPETET